MQPSRHRLYIIACAGMFVFGMVLALPGTLIGLPEVVERFHLTIADRGALISSLFVGVLAGSLASGPIVDAVGHRAALSGSAALIAATMPLIALAPNGVLAGAALAVVGLACAGVNTTANALASELFPEERARRMNGLAIAVGVGGLSMPAATASMAGVVSGTTIVLAGALIAAVVAIAALRTSAPARPPASHTGAAAFVRVLREPAVGWIAGLVLLGAGTEAAMAGFTSTYLTSLGVAPAQATALLSMQWVGLIAARLAFARRVDRAKVRAILVASLAAAAAVVMFATASSWPVLAAAPFVIGVAIAIIMPTSLAVGGERYPHNGGTLFGVLLAVAQAGAIALPALIGVTADAAGLRVGMSIIAVNNVAIAAICLKLRS